MKPLYYQHSPNYYPYNLRGTYVPQSGTPAFALN